MTLNKRKTLLKWHGLYRCVPDGGLKEADPQARVPTRSQLSRCTDLIQLERTMLEEVARALDDPAQTISSRLLYDTPEERDALVRELLDDLRLKSLLHLHVLIEQGDKEALFFAIKELLKTGFISEEIQKMDDEDLQHFLKFLDTHTKP